MQMLEIAAHENGAHSNQTCHGFLPDGWAVILDDMTMEAFPFGTVEAAVDEKTGLMTVTAAGTGTRPGAWAYGGGPGGRKRPTESTDFQFAGCGGHAGAGRPGR